MGKVILSGQNKPVKLGIDKTNILKTSSTYIPTSSPWTATEDCLAVVTYANYNIHLEIDGITVFQSNANSTSTAIFSAYLKKGQSLAVYQTGNHTGSEASVIVYGLL